MTYKQAYKRLGGKSRMDTMASALSEKYGITVNIVPHINDEEPKDNWLNVLFVYHPSKQNKFIKASDELIKEFNNRDMDIRFECSGDGDNAIVMSYRVF